MRLPFRVLLSSAVAALMLLTVVPAAWADETPGESAEESTEAVGKDRDSRFQEWQRMFARRAQSIRAHQRAMGYMSKLADDLTADYEIQWACSRAFYYFSQRYEKQEDDIRRAIQLARVAVRCGERAVQANPGGFDGRYWLIANQVRVAAGESQLRAMREARAVAGELQRLIEAHPDRPEARMMLGGLYRVLPGPPISFGNNKRSLEILLEAEKVGDPPVELLLELGETYAAVGNIPKALEYFEKGKTGPGYPGMDFEAEDARAYARQRHEELSKR